MAIRRSEKEINPLEYTLKYRVNPKDTEFWDSGSDSFDASHPDHSLATTACAIHGPTDFFVPTFQRGIEWTWDKLLECISSSSPLLGEVTFGIEVLQPDKIQLLDGLQRFAAFAALTRALTPALFADKDSDIGALITSGDYHTDLESKLYGLRLIGSVSRGAEPVLRYNDAALRNHRRAVIQESYAVFADLVAAKVEELLRSNGAESKRFLDQVSALYQKGMWANVYQGFSSHEELVSAFVGWNAIRIELGVVDLCRAALINRGSQAGWSHGDFVEAEEKFNSLLLESGGRHKKYYGPLITLLHEDWFERREFNLIPKLRSQKPTWKVIGAQFDRLSECMDYFDGQHQSIDLQKHEYIKFLKLLGDLPFITTLIYHYKLAASRPRTSIDKLVNADVLHKLCVSYLRRFLDRGIGNTGDIATEVLQGRLPVKKWLERVCPPRSGDLDTAPNPSWLELRLDNIGISGAKAVFGACLLPSHTKKSGSRQWGTGSFVSIYYRAPGRPKWSLDHVIPNSKLARGFPYKDSLRNLLPVLTTDNSSYSATDADTKITSKSAWYAKYRDSADVERAPNGTPHPLHDGVFAKQGKYSAKRLNDGKRLAGPTGKERLTILHRILLDRL